MSKQSRYIPTGELQGDTSPMRDKGGSRQGDYGPSLGEASRADLADDKGYYGRRSIASSTRSDRKGFA